MSYPDQIYLAASSEFIALCQSQVALLTQGLGAAWSAVYLTERLAQGTDAKLTPVLVYPSPIYSLAAGTVFDYIAYYELIAPFTSRISRSDSR